MLSPAISKDDKLFKNKYFQISYPSDWSVIEEPSDDGDLSGCLFIDLKHRKYNILVTFSDDKYMVQNIMNGKHPGSKVNVLMDHSSKQGKYKVDSSEKIVIFDKKRAIKITMKIDVVEEGESREIEYCVICVMIKPALVGIISTNYDSNFSEDICVRINSVVNSTHF